MTNCRDRQCILCVSCASAVQNVDCKSTVDLQSTTQYTLCLLYATLVDSESTG